MRGEAGLMILDRILISFPVLLLPFLLGGVHPWYWGPVAGIFLATALIVVWGDHHAAGPGVISKKAFLFWCLLLSCPFLQALPLPLSWLKLLSPQRLFWYETVIKMTNVPSWMARTVAYTPIATVFAGIWWVFLVGYGVVLRRVIREERELNWFFAVLFFVAGLEAFYGLMQVLIPTLGVLWASKGQGIARGTFVNRNHYAAFLGMMWPILLAYLLSISKRSGSRLPPTYSDRDRDERIYHKQLFLAFVTGLILLALFFSQSRGGIISAMITLSVFVAFKPTRRGWMLPFLVGCWVVMLVYGSIIGFEGILNRFDQIAEGDPGRFLIWRDSWHLIREHPWMGVGLGGYGTVFQIYQSHLPDTLQTSHAHNDYLQLAAELGLPVATALAALVWGYWWQTVRRLRRWSGSRKADEGREAGRASVARASETEPVRNQHVVIAIGALAGSAGFLCHSWLEFNWQIPANQLYFVILLVLMAGVRRTVQPYTTNVR